MAKFSLSLLLALSLLAFSPLCLCHKYQGGYLFPQFYDHSCPRAQEIVKSVVAKASGGPNWEVPLGRRDSRGASLSGSNNDIPAPNNTFQTILTKFKRQGLDLVDLVALSGSHTIGDARCTSFRQRLYNQNGNGKPDFTLHPTYAAQLRNRCPRSGSDQNLFFLDFVSPTRFDNTYFKNLTLPYTTASPELSQPTPERVSAIAEEISGLTLLEVTDLTEVLREKLGVKEMPTMVMMMPGMGFGDLRGAGKGGAGAAKGEEKKVEKTAFDVKLDGFDAATKIKVIKEVRTFTALGLKEAKELVEKAPTLLKKGVTKEEAETIIAKMKEVGAKVSMEFTARAKG
ncbi:hypothetical protein G4B88_002050 [Cannabis sativa]|uniref:Peroxidase n=1 Tax=Cannabis sativa TaxID=3483 RepID=A0A7J6HD94_CANSA|nr:hypothetical protein G4B88_002050 [Cannabis sativa]